MLDSVSERTLWHRLPVCVFALHSMEAYATLIAIHRVQSYQHLGLANQVLSEE
jgi:hypothetical protein